MYATAGMAKHHTRIKSIQLEKQTQNSTVKTEPAWGCERMLLQALWIAFHVLQIGFYSCTAEIHCPKSDCSRNLRGAGYQQRVLVRARLETAVCA
jgi:hypothetical protein